MSSQAEPSFGKLRSLLWPIHYKEMRKLIPMWFMLFFICFNYTVLRCMKDAMIVPVAGAEVLPFIKVWVMLPMAVLMTCVFTRLTNRYSQERVFYLIIGGFLITFALFAFVIYPLRDHLHLHGFADMLEGILPQGCRGFINMIRYWTLTGFYVVSELWGIVVMSVLFWGFANEVTKIDEAGRFYGVLGVAANFSSIIAGQAANFLSQGDIYNPKLPFGSSAWEQTIMLVVLATIGCGLITIALFRWLNKYELIDPAYDELHRERKPVKMKKKLSLLESFSYLSRSKYLICIAILVVAYNLVINMVEVVWKDQLRQLYPSQSHFHSYINNLTSVIGIISTLTAFFMGKIIGRLGWTRTALVTPIIMLVTSIGFFSFVVFENSLAPFAIALTGATPIAVAVFFGAAQNCLSKAAKYSVFDSTKEMSFIPLDHECKLKGKAAIDGVGSRLGKSGGSFIHQGLLMFFITFSASAPYVALILIGVIVAWVYAVSSLGIQFGDLVARRKQEKTQKDTAKDSPEWQESGSQLEAAS